MKAKERDAAVAEAAGKKIDKLVRSLAHVQRTDDKLEYHTGLAMCRAFQRYTFTKKKSTKKLQRSLYDKGFKKLMTPGTDDGGPVVLSKSVEHPGTRQLVQVAIHEDRIVCKCYVGAHAAPF